MTIQTFQVEVDIHVSINLFDPAHLAGGRVRARRVIEGVFHVFLRCSYWASL